MTCIAIQVKKIIKQKLQRHWEKYHIMFFEKCMVGLFKEMRNKIHV